MAKPKRLNDAKVRRAVELSLTELQCCRDLIASELVGKVSQQARKDLTLLEGWLEHIMALLNLEQYRERMSWRRASWLLAGATLSLNGAIADGITIDGALNKSVEVIEQQCVIVEGEGDQAMGSSGTGHEIGYADGAEGLTHQGTFDQGKFDEGKFEGGSVEGASPNLIRLDDPTTGVLG